MHWRSPISQTQCFRLDYDSQRPESGLTFSLINGNRQKWKKNEKDIFASSRMSQFVDCDTPSWTMTAPGDEDEKNEICITGQVQHSAPRPKSTRSARTSAEFCTTLDKNNNCCGGLQIGKCQSTKHKPNPNGRGRSASVMSEVSSTASYETKEAEIMKDTTVLRPPSQWALLDETTRSSMLSTPESKHALSDVRSASDFEINSQQSSESHLEVREFPCPKSAATVVKTSECSLKPTLLKALPFLTEPEIYKDTWHTVSYKKKRQEKHVITKKPSIPSPHKYSELSQSESFLRISKKCRRRKKKNNNLKPSKQKNIQTTVFKKENRPKASFENHGAKSKCRKNLCHFLKEYLLGMIMWWSIKRN
jgi:hypothetical protein